MKTLNFRSRQQGFSLLEVLVAVVVMSVGLLALAALQLSVIRSSSEAKTEAMATQIAKDRIEAMRSFTSVEPGYRNLTGTGGWVSVTDNSAFGGVTFERQDTVTRYVYNKATSAFTNSGITNTMTTAQILAACAQCLTSRDFKKVQVDVRWTDAAGTQRTMSMEDLVDSLEPSESAKVVRTNTGSSPRKVKVVIVNPGSVGGVIPIAIGDGTSTAASNPTPQIRGNTNVVSETRFDVYTYAAINSSLATAESRVETTVMHCTCSTANAPASGSRGYRPTYWNGYRYAPPTLTSYTPPAGWTGGSNESPLCDACCRDHNDPAGVSGPKFDPWRATHNHYRVSGVAPGTLTLANTGTYDEACRLIRVEGIWRVAADLRDDYFALLETNNSGSLTATDETTRPYSPSTSGTSNYQNFVLDYLDDRISNNSVSSTYNTASAGSYPLDSGSYESTYTLNNPATIQVPIAAAVDTDTSKWLHARGLYIDYLEPDAITAITTARTNCPDTSTQTLRSACVLPYVPFTSINLTELAEWQSQSPVSTTNFNVTDDYPYDPDNLNKPKRGNVYKGSSPTNNATGTIYANLSESNAGLALLRGSDNVSRYQYIDTDEQTNFTAVSPSKGHDTQAVQVQNGGGGGGGNDTVFTLNVVQLPTAITVIGNSPSSGTCTMVTNPANCSVNPNGSPMKLQVDGYTKAATISVPNGCKSNGSVNMTINKDYDITYAKNVTQGNLAATSIVASGDGTINDRTIITFAGTVAANDQLEIRFDGNPNPQWWCPSNYNVQQNKANGGAADPPELNCSGNNPTFSTTYVVCPSGTPGMPVASP